MTLENFVKNTDLNENIIWVQKYGASREIEAVTDMAEWSKKLLQSQVFVKDKFASPKRNKVVLVVRFVGDNSNEV